MSIRTTLRTTACMLLALAPAFAVAATPYKLTQLGDFGDGDSVANSINNAGQIAGIYSLSNHPPQNIFRFEDGVIEDLSGGSIRGGRWVIDTIFDNQGDVVATARSQAGNQHSFRAFRMDGGSSVPLAPYHLTDGNQQGQFVGVSPWGVRSVVIDDGVATDLGNFGGSATARGAIPGGPRTQASAINDSGQIVGSSLAREGGRAFLYENGEMVDLNTLVTSSDPQIGIAWSASDINEFGGIVGSATTDTGFSHAFLFDNGVMSDLGVLPGMNSSSALAMNNLGQVIGTSSINRNESSAFLYDSVNGMSNLLGLVVNGDGWDSISVADINDLGVIVGAGFRDGRSHAIMISPVPEAETWVMLIVGLGMVLFLVRRQRATASGLAGAS